MSRLSISATIPRLLNEMNRPDVVHKKDLIADYVMEAVRLIGTYHDLDFCPNVRVNIEDYWGRLPETAYDIEDVNYCVDNTGGGWSGSCSCNTNPCSCHLLYSKTKLLGWRMEGCNLWVPQPSGVVSVDLWSLPLDNEGLPMLYESTAMAARAYLRYVFSESLFEEGKITIAAFQMRKQRWEELCSIARGVQSVPTRERLALAARISNDPAKFIRFYGRR